MGERGRVLVEEEVEKWREEEEKIQAKAEEGVHKE